MSCSSFTKRRQLNYEGVSSSDITASTNRFVSGVASYDAAGNITTDSKFRSLTYAYDANGRQTSASNGTWTESQVYDSAGQRVQTTANSVTRTMIYDVFGQDVADYSGSSLERENIYRGGQLVATYEAGTSSWKYVMQDEKGSTRALMNNSGGSSSVIARHDYLPFGEEIASGIGSRTIGQGFAATDTNRQKYAMTERDDVTGLDHTWWRKYESFSGRWTSPDPYNGSMTIASPQSFNRYPYTQNDPVNFVDPSGLACQLLWQGAIYYLQLCNPYDRNKFDPFSPKEGGGGGTRDPNIPDPPNPSPQKPTPTPNPNCIRNAVAGNIGTSRGLIPALGPNGPTGRASHDGDHVLSGPGGPAAVTTLGPLAGTVLRTGNQGDGLHYVDVRLNSSIAGVAYNVRYKDLLTVGVAVGNRLGAGSSIGTVRPAEDPRSEIGLHVTLVQRSEYAGYVNRVRNGQYSPIGIFMSAVNDPRSPVRCP